MESSFTFFIILLVCSAFFSLSETALFSLSRVQVHKFRHSKSHAAQTVVQCLRKPRDWLATILIGNELANVLISIIGAAIVNHYFKASVQTQTLVAIAVITPVVLVLGEIIPKNLAMRFSLKLATAVIIPLSLFHQLVKPFRFVLRKIADGIVIVLGGSSEKLPPMVMEEEFRHLVDLGKKEGVIVEEERKMIHNVFEFSDKTVLTIMTPFDQIFTISSDIEHEALLNEIRLTQFSRIPVYEGHRNNIIGILHMRDLFGFHRQRQAGHAQNLRSILRKPLFVKPDTQLEKLLENFQQERNLMAIVQDQGQVLGLVTMDDLLEEIFGEMEK
ncbi:MAG: hemolysin family protein [Pseudomonadota bacterium]